MPKEFPDRSDRLFGRERDLAALAGRVRFKGLTAVVGTPQMGKSWLMQELARRLAGQTPGCEPTHLVGFSEQFGQTPDLLVRAVADLYVRWLSDAGMAEQARMVWSQQKGNLLPGVAETVSKIFAGAVEAVAKPLTDVVDGAIKGLIAANETLTSGGIRLPVLQYEQARDLVATVARISDRPIALVLDQWERSPDATMESRTLDAFLHHLDDWPACHLFLALRPDEPAFGIVQTLEASLPGTVEIYPLELMDLGDAQECDRLMSFLGGRVPAAQRIPDSTMLQMIEGYPGVIYQWTSDYQRQAMQSADDLRQVAADAHKFRFRELEELLPGLKGDARRLSVRLALLPSSAEKGVWDLVKELVLSGIEADALDDLRRGRVLESADPPSFGHAKRWDAARGWFIENRKAAAKREAEGLIFAFASRVHDSSAETITSILALIRLGEVCAPLELPDDLRAVCSIALSFIGPPSDFEILLCTSQVAKGDPRFAPLAAMGLYNMLYVAGMKRDVKIRDVMLTELREIAKRYPEIEAVCEQFAKGLFNSFYHAQEEGDLPRRDALLDELRALAAAHAEDVAVREMLAIGLSHMLIDARAKDDLIRFEALRDELCDLAELYSEDELAQAPWYRALMGRPGGKD
jgi:hypothetical protein